MLRTFSLRTLSRIIRTLLLTSLLMFPYIVSITYTCVPHVCLSFSSQICLFHYLMSYVVTHAVCAIYKQAEAEGNPQSSVGTFNAKT